MQHETEKALWKEQACVEKLKLLADPTRFRIISILSEREYRVSEINDNLGIEANLLSHHLKVLREGGLLEAERRGKTIVYRIAEGVLCEPNASSLDLGCCNLSFPRQEKSRVTMEKP